MSSTASCSHPRQSTANMKGLSDSTDSRSLASNPSSVRHRWYLRESGPMSKVSSTIWAISRGILRTSAVMGVFHLMCAASQPTGFGRASRVLLQ